MLFEQMRQKPFFILGPCVMENQDLLYHVAEKVAEAGQKFQVPVVFKSSFDKANRTSIHSYRGPGIEKGMEMLQNVKDKFNLPVTTDIHEPYQAAIAAQVVDILQIPAFLCRQTDLLVAAAKTGKIVNVKKAQFLSGQDMFYPAQKVVEAGNEQVILTERGNMYGYNNQSTEVLQRWRNPGDITNVPRALYNDGFNWLGSDRYVEDGSFIRLRSVTARYTFAKALTSRLGLRNASVYVTAENLFTFTGYTGQDPEVSVRGSDPFRVATDDSMTPPTRNLVLGVVVGF